MTEPRTAAGREAHTLLHRLSTQMKTCEMVPCPFAGLARRVEAEAAEPAPLDAEAVRLLRAVRDADVFFAKGDWPLSRAIESFLESHDARLAAGDKGSDR